MTKSRAALEESILFELFILETATTNKNSSCFDSIDFRSPDGKLTVTSSILVSASEEEANSLKNSFIPLTFGAAWKIVDLIIEFALNNDRGIKKKRWSIEEKKRLAMTGICNQILPGCSDLSWNAIMFAYGTTTEHRHCLVHRRANIDHSTGDMNGVDQSGQPLTTLTQRNQTAFANAALIFSKCILVGGMTFRENERLLHYLDQLSNHTQISIIDTMLPHQVQIRMSLLERDGAFVLDVKSALEIARNRFPSVAHFDLSIDIPSISDKTLVAAAEDCPLNAAIIELDALPPWIRFNS